MRFNIPLNKWEFRIRDMDFICPVTLPHTWNTDDRVMDYRGEAEYTSHVSIPSELEGKKAMIRFGAAFHRTEVYINGKSAGVNDRSGYLPFEFDVTDLIEYGEYNEIRVVTDNRRSEDILPWGDEFDWADDGGLVRRADLGFFEKDGIETVHVTPYIGIMKGKRCSGGFDVDISYYGDADKPAEITVYEYLTGVPVARGEYEPSSGKAVIPFEDLYLWSPSRPFLYNIKVETDNDVYETRTGIRMIEVRGEKIYLNDREIYLKGAEWMPGSHPDFGMAEPLDHSIKCLRQLKDAGCVFTRFHWQQDDSIFDWCDENGLLVQEEIPYWGSPKESTPLQHEIARQHADGMLKYHYNHPSIICWCVGNELGADTAPTINYITETVKYFRDRDPSRLVNYVSNTLSRKENLGKDDGTLHGDIAMWNEYLGTWEETDDLEAHVRRTCKRAEGMPVVITEFGLCEPQFEGGDTERCRILKERIDLYGKIPNICGYVWFSLNDYRTFRGEEGKGKFCRRVHGSTDMYGNEKPSYRLLCDLQKNEREYYREM